MSIAFIAVILPVGVQIQEVNFTVKREMKRMMLVMFSYANLLFLDATKTNRSDLLNGVGPILSLAILDIEGNQK